jgi:molecular chaperone Hsp33
MKDYMIRATAAEGQIRAFATTTKNTVQEAVSAHGLSPVAAAGLGRLMTGGAMMGSMMKGEDDLLTLQILCDGPIGGITVTADSKGRVKGYVNNPQVMLPANAKGKLDVGGAVGAGTLRVIRDMGLKEPYIGQTELVSGEIAEDLTYYFAASEQVPSSVALGVLMNKDNTVAQAGGFIIQLMPFAEEAVIAKLEERIQGFTSITSVLSQGKTPEMILEDLLGDMGMQVNDRMPVEFYCNCSKERVEKVLISLGKKELMEMIREGKTIEMNCHFCNRKYLFTVGEMEELVK